MHHKLPVEILESIFCEKVLDCRDILNLSRTCLKFSSICQSDKIWMVQLLKRWQPKFQRCFKEGNNLRCKFKELYAEETSMVEVISELSKVKNRFQLAMVERLEDLTMDPVKLTSVLDVMLTLKQTVCENQSSCAKKVFEHLYYCHLKKLWIEILTSPHEDQSHIEQGSILISQWTCPESGIYTDDIVGKIDVIADAIKKTLPDELRLVPITSYRDSLIVMNAMNEVIYRNMNFKGNKNANTVNSHIHTVLEKREGNPLSLGVLYMSVARRLGLQMQGVNFPGHFLLRLMCKDEVDSKIYVDASNDGKLLNKDQCLELLGSRYIKWSLESLFRDINDKRLFLRLLTEILYALRDDDDDDDEEFSTFDSINTLEAIKALMCFFAENEKA